MKIIKQFSYILLLFSIVFLASCNAPKAVFNYTQTGKAAPAKVTFSNESKKAETYEWDFGDKTTSEDPNPSHRYTNSGTYTITLKASKGKKVSVLTKTITVDSPKDCSVILMRTTYGDMVIKLYNETPKHRDNFIKLVEKGYYNDLLFHRVINGFMIQGGDPDSKNAKPGQPLGMGGPNYKVSAEFVDTLVHIKGALAAARQSDQVNPEKESSGSQFYIVHGRSVSDDDLDNMEARTGIPYALAQRKAYKTLGGTPFLDHSYTVFGQIIEGLDVIEHIASVETSKGQDRDRPVKDIKIKMFLVK